MYGPTLTSTSLRAACTMMSIACKRWQKDDAGRTDLGSTSLTIDCCRPW